MREEHSNWGGIGDRELTEEEKETMRNCFLNEKDSPYWVMILICFLFFGCPNLNVYEFFLIKSISRKTNVQKIHSLMRAENTVQ